MINIAVVDDEKIWQIKAIEAIKKYWHSECEIDTFFNGTDFVRSSKSYDIVFMDIELKEENGFDVYESYQNLHRSTLLILLTSHIEFARKGYQYNAFRYIDKMHLEELEEAIESIQKRFMQRRIVEVTTVEGVCAKIQISEIVYVEAQGHNVHVVMDKKRIVCYKKLTDVQELLGERDFYLIHRSYLVNFAWVKNHSIHEMIMKNGDVISVSRRRYTEFKQKWFEWLFERGCG